jgi:acyl-CoA thioesterase-2
MTATPDFLPSGTLSDLLALLDLDTVGPDRFVGHSADPSAERIFGGQVAAQAVVAAGRTVPPGRTLASVQATFLRAGDPRTPLDFEVARPADGRTFAFRQVTARQRDRLIFTLAATFHRGDSGPEHGTASGEFDVGIVPAVAPDIAAMTTGAYELRLRAATPDNDTMRIALRTAGPLPDEPLVHAALAVHASDLYILDAALGPHEVGWFEGRVAGMSIDHTMFFHTVPRLDRWVISRLTSPIARSGRPIVSGEMRDERGELLVTILQHGLIRWLAPTGGDRE